MTDIYTKWSVPIKNATSTIITGVKSKNKSVKKAFITGFCTVHNKQMGYIYYGSVNYAEKGKASIISFPNSYSTSPYGPDYNSDTNTLSIVGNYVLTQNSNAIGFYYNGLSNMEGIWVSIVPPFENAYNTIVHSVKNGIMVGNYGQDLSGGSLKTARIFAFLYNSNNNMYYRLQYKNSNSISAYGIVQDTKNNYIICGGLTRNKKNKAFICSWNKKTGIFSEFKTYSYGSAIITHFDGIYKKNNVYVLTGDCVLDKAPSAFYAEISYPGRKQEWATIEYPDSKFTSGNTVIGNTCLGIYIDSAGKTNGYTYNKN